MEKVSSVAAVLFCFFKFDYQIVLCVEVQRLSVYHSLKTCLKSNHYFPFPFPTYFPFLYIINVITITGTLLPYILLGSFNSASTRGNQFYTDLHDSFAVVQPAKISRLIPVQLFVKDVCHYALLFFFFFFKFLTS